MKWINSVVFLTNKKNPKLDSFFTLEMLQFSFKVILYFTVSYNLNKSQKENILKMKYFNSGQFLARKAQSQQQ